MSKQKSLFDVNDEVEQTLRIQRIVSKRQLSEFLGISERLIEFEMAAGRMPYLKIGRKSVRFDVPAVLESIRNRE